MLSRAGLWSVQLPRFTRCSGVIGLHLDYGIPTQPVHWFAALDDSRNRLVRAAQRPHIAFLTGTAESTAASREFSDTTLSRLEFLRSTTHRYDRIAA